MPWFSPGSGTPRRGCRTGCARAYAASRSGVYRRLNPITFSAASRSRSGLFPGRPAAVANWTVVKNGGAKPAMREFCTAWKSGEPNGSEREGGRKSRSAGISEHGAGNHAREEVVVGQTGRRHVLDLACRPADEPAHDQRAVILFRVRLGKLQDRHRPDRVPGKQDTSRTPETRGEQVGQLVRALDGVLEREAVLREARVRQAEPARQQRVTDVVKLSCAVGSTTGSAGSTMPWA